MVIIFVSGTEIHERGLKYLFIDWVYIIIENLIMFCFKKNPYRMDEGFEKRNKIEMVTYIKTWHVNYPFYPIT